MNTGIAPIASVQINMKYANTLKSAAALMVLAAGISLLAQAPGEPGGPGGTGGRGGRGGGGFFGPALPPEQQALVDKINAELVAENAAVTVANSNLVVVSFITPKDSAKITEANKALAKAREAWAAKASKLVAQIQASDHKLSKDAIARLVTSASGRGGRGGFGGRGGPDGRGPGGGGPPPQ